MSQWSFSNTETFDFVLLAETDPDSKHNEALVFVGPEGEKRIEAPMSSIAVK